MRDEEEVDGRMVQEVEEKGTWRPSSSPSPRGGRDLFSNISID